MLIKKAYKGALQENRDPDSPTIWWLFGTVPNKDIMPERLILDEEDQLFGHTLAKIGSFHYMCQSVPLWNLSHFVPRNHCCSRGKIEIIPFHAVVCTYWIKAILCRFCNNFWSGTSRQPLFFRDLWTHIPCFAKWWVLFRLGFVGFYFKKLII